MKRLLPLCLLLIASIFANTRSTAQITGLNIVYAGDTSTMPCSIPAIVNVVGSGTITGSPGANDSITLYFNFGPGGDTTMKVPVFQTWFSSGGFHRIQTMVGTFSTMVVATFNGISDTAYSIPQTYSNTCEDLSGRVFVDANSNCTYDAGELPLKWHMVDIINTSTSNVMHVMTDSVGMYYAQLPAGTYTIEPQVAGNITPACPSTGITTLTVSTGPYVENFAYNCNPTATVDVAVHGWSAGFRPGFNRTLSVNATSTNLCATHPATLTVSLDPRLSYTSTAYGPAPTVSGTTLTWAFTNLGALQNFMSTMNIYCTTTANVGDTACILMSITTTAVDNNPSNNTLTLCVPIRNSFDPNDKHVSPKGRESAGYVINGTELTYRINFQNTGNDVAYDVTVKDVIDDDLDISTLRVLNTSHVMKPTMVADNEIAFRFENINLPDSNTNEPASHGHVVYTIKPKAPLPHGRQMHNTARIYFDYNAPIITNTTLNTIEIPTGIQHLSKGTLKASVYPNPVQQEVYVETEGADKFSIAMYDVLGRSILVQEGKNGKAALDVSKLSNGTYLLQLSNGEKELTTRITVQH